MAAESSTHGAPDPLRQSEERLRYASRATRDVIWDLDLAADCLWRSEAMHTQLGFAPETVGPGLAWFFSRLHPEDRRRVEYGWEAAITGTGDRWADEFCFQRPDDTYAHIIDQGFILRDTRGRAVRVIGAMQDVSARREAQEALHQSEESLRLATEAGQIGTCDWHYPTGKTRWNDVRFRLFGLEPQDRLMDMEEFFALVHPADRERVRREMYGGVEERGEHHEEFRVVHPDGSMHWILETGRVIAWQDGKPLRVIGVLFDVTGRRAADAAVRQSEETLRLVLENAREYAIISTDLDCLVTTWNAGAERLLGYREQEILGQPAAIIFTPEDRAAGLPGREERLALAEGRVSHECWHVRKDGRRFWGSGVLTTMHTGSSEPIGFVKVFRDRTVEQQTHEERERSRAELQAALHAAEHARAEAEAAGRAKDHFLAVLSHELRTPLTPVMMLTRTLARRKDLPPEVTDALAIIQRNIQTEARFIDELLDLTHSTHGKLEINRQPTDLHEVLRHAVEVSEPDLASRRQRLEIALDAPEHRLDGDATRLQQVFWNLLKNASKFTPEDGLVRLESRPGEPGWVIVEVIDTGIGIPADALARIFDPFEQADRSITRQFGGLGLGLAIARAAVAAHGGNLTAHSPGQGQGATFTVQLPLAVPVGYDGTA